MSSISCLLEKKWNSHPLQGEGWFFRMDGNVRYWKEHFYPRFLAGVVVFEWKPKFPIIYAVDRLVHRRLQLYMIIFGQCTPGPAFSIAFVLFPTTQDGVFEEGSSLSGFLEMEIMDFFLPRASFLFLVLFIGRFPLID